MSIDIGSLIVSTPEIRHGKLHIAGKGITIHRIVTWYKQGYSPRDRPSVDGQNHRHE